MKISRKWKSLTPCMMHFSVQVCSAQFAHRAFRPKSSSFAIYVARFALSAVGKVSASQAKVPQKVRKVSIRWAKIRRRSRLRLASAVSSARSRRGSPFQKRQSLFLCCKLTQYYFDGCSMEALSLARFICAQVEQTTI